MDRQEAFVTRADGTMQPQDGVSDNGEYEDEEQSYIRIDKRNLSGELNRVLREDKDFANLYYSHVGSKAAERYNPVVRQQEFELQELRRERRKAELEAMPDAEVERRFATDQQFAREWTEFAHDNPEATASRREQFVIAGKIEQIFNEAAAYGLPQEVVVAYQQRLAQNGYDFDETGRPVTHWSDGLDRLRRDLNYEIVSRMQQPSAEVEEEAEPSEQPARRTLRPAPRQTEQPSAPVNPALLSGGPDNTPSSRVATARRPTYRTQAAAAKLYNEGRITAAEYRAAKSLPFE